MMACVMHVHEKQIFTKVTTSEATMKVRFLQPLIYSNGNVLQRRSLNSKLSFTV